MKKKCTKCGMPFPVEDFHRNKATKDGRAHRCKSCRRGIWLDYYRDNGPRIKQRRREANRLRKRGVSG